jgi:hypothetical protein
MIAQLFQVETLTGTRWNKWWYGIELAKAIKFVQDYRRYHNNVKVRISRCNLVEAELPPDEEEE